TAQVTRVQAWGDDRAFKRANAAALLAGGAVRVAGATATSAETVRHEGPAAESLRAAALRSKSLRLPSRWHRLLRNVRPRVPHAEHARPLPGTSAQISERPARPRDLAPLHRRRRDARRNARG